MSIARWKAWGAAALLFAASAACGAELEPTNVLTAGIYRQSMRDADGGSIDAHWIGTNERRVLTAGASLANIGANQWTTLRVSAAQNRATRAALSGSVEIGPGSGGGGRFTVLKTALGVSKPLTERWRITARSSYVDVGDVSGHRLTLGGATTRGNALSLRLETSRSTSGTLDERSLLARIDFRGKAPYVMAGVATSITNDRLTLGAPSAAASKTRIRQAFGGASFPLRRHELTVTLELGKVGDERRSGVSFFVRSPLGTSE